MSSQSWFGNGAIAAPQDGSRSRERVRSEDLQWRLPSGRALARRFNFSQASLCNAFLSRLEVFSRYGNSHGPGGRNPYERRTAIVGTGEWEFLMRLSPSPPLQCLRDSAPGGELCLCDLHLSSCQPRRREGKPPSKPA